jgi:hypothetical protein
MIARSMTAAAQLTRTWVAIYTAGLPDELACRRRDEIESDLWEQELLGGVSNGEALARLVFGIPADLLWRLDQRITSAHRQPERRSFMSLALNRGIPILILLFAALNVFYGVAITVRGSNEDNLTWAALFGVGTIAAAAALATGYMMLKRSPWMGAGMIALGAAAITAIQFWMFVIYVPIALVIIAFAVFRARDYSGNGPTAPA